jgi:hypothetical protein
MFDFTDFDLGEFECATAGAEKLAVKSGKEPSLYFAAVEELVSFSGPAVEGLLGEICGLGFTLAETVAEAVKRLVVEFYELIKRQIHSLRTRQSGGLFHFIFVENFFQVMGVFFHESLCTRKRMRHR